MRILLADDDVNIHLVVKMWLKRNGHEVVSAYNGKEALDMLKAESYEGLITDVNMPIMKGMDLVKEVQNLENRPEMIVVLTSRCDLNQLREELPFPGVNFFNKPFSPAVLANLIEKLQKERLAHNG